MHQEAIVFVISEGILQSFEIFVGEVLVYFDLQVKELMVELLFELLEGAFDVVSLLNLNAEHGNSDWAPKIRNF